MVDRLQEEILSMTVRKELLAHAMEQISQKHQVSTKYGLERTNF